MPNRGKPLSAHITVSVHSYRTERRTFAEILPGEWRLVHHAVVEDGDEQHLETGGDLFELAHVVRPVAEAVTVIDTGGTLPASEVVALFPAEPEWLGSSVELDPGVEAEGLPHFRDVFCLQPAPAFIDGVAYSPFADDDETVRWLPCDEEALEEGKVVPQITTVVDFSAYTEGGVGWVTSYRIGWIDSETAARVGVSYSEQPEVALEARGGRTDLEVIASLVESSDVPVAEEALAWCVEHGEAHLEYNASDDYLDGEDEDDEVRFSPEDSVDELTFSVDLSVLAAPSHDGRPLRSIT